MTTRMIALTGLLLIGSAAGWLIGNRFVGRERADRIPDTPGKVYVDARLPFQSDQTTAGEPPTALSVTGSSTGDVDTDVTPATDVLMGLQEALEIEMAQRRLLESQVRELADKVAKLEEAVPAGKPLVTARAGVVRDEGGAVVNESEKRAARRAARFLAAGFNTEEAQQLTQQMEEVEMEQLYLRDRARREGWLRTPEYRRARSELRNQLREEMGEEVYDRFLYGAGRNNRVLVDSVLEDSPAQQTGLQSGDMVVGYDGKRVFSFGDLRRESARGVAGDPVEIRVERNGEVLDLEILRGPLGVRLNSLSVIPNQDGVDTRGTAGRGRRRRL